MVRVEIIGNLGRDCVVRDGKNGSKFASFTVASHDFFNGEEKTQWFDCMWFDPNEKMTQYLKKGSGVYLTGTFDCVNEVGQDGSTYLRRKVNVDFVTFNSTGKAQGDNGTAAAAQTQAAAPQQQTTPSMYGSREAVPEVNVPMDTTFNAEADSNSDLPF